MLLQAWGSSTARACWNRPRLANTSQHLSCQATVSGCSKSVATQSQPSLTKRKVVVIGGGIGGLITGGRLAREGFDVEMFEQNAEVGGRCQSMSMDGHRFDTGPSLLLFIDTYRKAFASLGSSLEAHLQAVRIGPAAYRVWFQEPFTDGSRHIDLLTDVAAMSEQLERVEEGAGQQYMRWLESATAALRVGVREFIDRDFEGWADLLDLRRLLPLLGQVNVLELIVPHHTRLSLRFKDARLRALLTFQNLYVGLSPRSAPGVFSLLAATEIVDGVWYPLGGFRKVREGLRTAAEACGLRITTDTKVTHITSTADGRSATGVVLMDGTHVAADVVISNRDVPLSYELLHTSYGDQQSSTLSQQDFSAGVIAYNWSLDQQLPQLLHHNVFLSGEFERSWERATSPAMLCSFPNFYVHAPCRTDPSAAPAGHDSIMVLLPVANLQQMAASGYDTKSVAGPDSGTSPSVTHINEHFAADNEVDLETRRGDVSDSNRKHGNSDIGSLASAVTSPKSSSHTDVRPGGSQAYSLSSNSNGVVNDNNSGSPDHDWSGRDSSSSDSDGSGGGNHVSDLYRPLVDAGREAIFRTLAMAGVGDVRAHVLQEHVIDPVEWKRRYGLQHGAAFGLAHGLNQLALLRTGARDRHVKGLYMVGASARPGNGVPLVMIGADLAVQRVLQDFTAVSAAEQ